MIKSAKPPSITVAYICVAQSQNAPVMAQRFADSFRKYPPECSHNFTVICNGGSLSAHVSRMFNGLNPSFFVRSNDGWDIGGYLELANQSGSEMLLCLGESVHFHRAGWLERISNAWNALGPGMYGCLASYLVRPHLLTTAFACATELLRKYAPPVKTKEERYGFEHGPKAFWRKLALARYPAYLVTWDGVYAHQHWRNAENILWRGDQSNCLVWCNHTLKYMLASKQTKETWSKGADAMVRV